SPSIDVVAAGDGADLPADVREATTTPGDGRNGAEAALVIQETPRGTDAEEVVDRHREPSLREAREAHNHIDDHQLIRERADIVEEDLVDGDGGRQDDQSRQGVRLERLTALAGDIADGVAQPVKIVGEQNHGAAGVRLLQDPLFTIEIRAAAQRVVDHQ